MSGEIDWTSIPEESAPPAGASQSAQIEVDPDILKNEELEKLKAKLEKQARALAKKQEAEKSNVENLNKPGIGNLDPSYLSVLKKAWNGLYTSSKSRFEGNNAGGRLDELEMLKDFLESKIFQEKIEYKATPSSKSKKSKAKSNE